MRLSNLQPDVWNSVATDSQFVRALSISWAPRTYISRLRAWLMRKITTTSSVLQSSMRSHSLASTLASEDHRRATATIRFPGIDSKNTWAASPESFIGMRIPGAYSLTVVRHQKPATHFFVARSPGARLAAITLSNSSPNFNRAELRGTIESPFASSIFTQRQHRCGVVMTSAPSQIPFGANSCEISVKAPKGVAGHEDDNASSKKPFAGAIPANSPASWRTVVVNTRSCMSAAATVLSSAMDVTSKRAFDRPSTLASSRARSIPAEQLSTPMTHALGQSSA